MTPEEIKAAYPGMPIVTIETGSRETITFPLGRNNRFAHTQGSMILSAAISCVLPFEIEIELNRDGTWQLRSITTLAGGTTYNSYLHIDAHQEELVKIPPTKEQTETIAKWFFHASERPFGIASFTTGGTLQGWAFQGLSREEMEAIGHPGREVYYNR